MSKKKNIHITLDADIYQMIESYREKRQLSRSAAVNRLLLLGWNKSIRSPLENLTDKTHLRNEYGERERFE